MAEEYIGGDAVYNQAALQQSRINKIFEHIDSMSVDMFTMDVITGNWYYKLIYNNLNSLLSTISPKLDSEELNVLQNLMRIIRGNIEVRPIFTIHGSIQFNGNGNKPTPNVKNRNALSDLLFEYRLEIERVMDKHGLSNPNKEGEGGWD